MNLQEMYECFHQLLDALFLMGEGLAGRSSHKWEHQAVSGSGRVLVPGRGTMPVCSVLQEQQLATYDQKTIAMQLSPSELKEIAPTLFVMCILTSHCMDQSSNLSSLSLSIFAYCKDSGGSKGLRMRQ